MSLIEGSAVYNWAARCEKRGFLPIDPSARSYFEDSDMEGTGIEEYEFKNIPELSHMIGKHTAAGDDGFAQMCAIEAFRNRPHMSENGKTEEHVDIPDFVYVF